MAKKTIQRKSNWKQAALFILGAFIVIFIYSNQIGKSNNESADAKLQRNETPRLTYSHPTMDFEITHTREFEVEERNHIVTFYIGERNIEITSNSTNYNDLTSHLSDPNNNLLEQTNNAEKMNINGYESIFGILNGERIYYIYAGSAVYFLSTSSPELYDELDAIAQSFRYLGE